MLLGAGDKSFDLIEIVLVDFDFVEEIEVDVFRVRFTAQFDLLGFHLTHYLSYKNNKTLILLLVFALLMNLTHFMGGCQTELICDLVQKLKQEKS